MTLLRRRAALDAWLEHAESLLEEAERSDGPPDDGRPPGREDAA